MSDLSRFKKFLKRRRRKPSESVHATYAAVYGDATVTKVIVRPWPPRWW